MRAGSWVLLVLTVGFAIGDWLAVHWRDQRLEHVCKPLTIVLLLATAASLDVDAVAVQHWFLVALALSLLGDVLLMVPRDLFVFGLAAFLCAHVAYIVGMWVDGVQPLAVVVGVALVGLSVAVVGLRIVESVRAGPDRGMAAPVVVYIGVISAMVASAVGTLEAFAIVGAALFYGSDALIAWERFVHPRTWHRVAIMVTYHTAQIGLVLSLLT